MSHEIFEFFGLFLLALFGTILILSVVYIIDYEWRSEEEQINPERVEYGTVGKDLIKVIVDRKTPNKPIKKTWLYNDIGVSNDGLYDDRFYYVHYYNVFGFHVKSEVKYDGSVHNKTEELVSPI